MAQEFKIGDVVQLKSGGPIMTIANTKLDNGQVLATWFDDKKPTSSVFNSEMLKKHEDR